MDTTPNERLKFVRESLKINQLEFSKIFRNTPVVLF